MNKRILTLLPLLLFGCTSGPTFIPESYLTGMAARQFSVLKTEVPISTDPVKTAMVNRVSRRIAEAIGPEMPDAEWEFVLFEEDSANAFAMPGGKIAVYTGLLKYVESDDELAAVVGHEIAHVQLKHSNQRMSAEVIRAAVGVATAIGTSDMEDDDRNAILAAYGIGTQVGIMLPFSRNHETEADRVGLMIAARAGYDPRAAIRFWQKMGQANPRSMPEFLSTHPSSASRIEDLEMAMPAAMEIYLQTRK